MAGTILKEILQFAIKSNASDVHFSSGMPPVLRIMGNIKRVDMPPLDQETLSGELMQLLDEKQKQFYHQRNDIDLAITMPDIGRLRLNIFNHFYGIGAAFRLFPPRIRTLDELHLPGVLKQIIRQKKGLVLVTGPAGSGKSTTLASMIHEINISRREHIITLEDPIEYLHTPLESIIHQRDIGIHSSDFASALRSTLREDPDIILVGEMRDVNTILNALQAAETGQLVLSTLHTNSAPEAIDRIINFFPAEQQQQIRGIVASTLVAVISQRLLPMATKRDRIALMEILIATKAVTNLIREGKTHQIESVIQLGADNGMQTFEKSFADLKQNALISKELKLSDFV